MAAPGERGHRAARLAAVAAVALVVGACAGRPGTSTVLPKPSTVPLAATSTLAPTTTSATATPATVAPSGPLTGQEHAWLQAITRLSEEMDEIWIDAAAADPTPAAMRSYANGLRGCRVALERTRPPSQRLQPAYEMAGDACAHYDRAARCFAAAARVGDPADAAEERRLERAIECGIDAAVDGGSRFVEAIAEAEIIGNAAGELAP